MNPITVNIEKNRLLGPLCFLLFIAFTSSLLHAIELSFDGDFVQGGLVIGSTSPNANILVNEKKVRVSDKGQFLIGINRDETGAVSISAHLNGERKLETHPILQRNYPIERIDGLPPEKVTPSKQHLQRIRTEGALVSKARSNDSQADHFSNGFIKPAQGRISGVYGSQRVLNGQPRRPHFGLDIAATTGSHVIAPASGVVTLVHSDMYFSGATLVIDHGHGLSSSFLHLNSIAVTQGEQVVQGQLIATVGQSGRASGPHLDWRINLFKRRLDPALLLKELDEKK